MSIIPSTWHESWNDFMTAETISELKKIEENIGTNFVPDSSNVLKFLQRNLSEIKCVWIGQDPYYTVYDNDVPVANGAAFWPSNLYDWNEPFSQRSLQNIVRLIYKAYNNINKYEDIKKYNEIKAEIKKETFNILPPQEWFTSIEKQGVLLLNTYLTTEKGKGNQHKKYWIDFSIKLLKYISEKNPEIYWFLWGNEAKAQKQYIQNGHIYESNHPTFCSIKYEDDFLKNDCFKDTMNIINWLG